MTAFPPAGILTPDRAGLRGLGGEATSPPAVIAVIGAAGRDKEAVTVPVTVVVAGTGALLAPTEGVLEVSPGLAGSGRCWRSIVGVDLAGFGGGNCAALVTAPVPAGPAAPLSSVNNKLKTQRPSA